MEDRHGIVLTVNYLAKPRGMKTGMAVWQAKQVCPELVVLPPDMPEYIRFSQMAREIYEDYSDQIEPFGLDENWIDGTGSVGLFGNAMTIAREISELPLDILTSRFGKIGRVLTFFAQGNDISPVKYTDHNAAINQLATARRLSAT